MTPVVGSVWGLILVLLALAAYWPALSGYLAFDDFAHIAPLFGRLSDFSVWALWEAVWSSNSGPTGRPLPMLTFSLEAAIPGWGAGSMKVSNLVLHLANALLIHRLASRLFEATGSLKPAWPALAVAALWLLHPLQLTGVAYLVQRMNQMAVFFTLLSLLAYLEARYRRPLPRIPPRRILLILVLWVCGVLSKGNAALLPFFVLLLELYLSPRLAGAAAQRRRDRRLIALAAAAWLTMLVLLLWPRVEASLNNPALGALPRLTTQVEVLAWYLRLLVAPDIGQMTLYHDQWPVVRALSASWWGALGLLSGLLIAAWGLRARAPLVSFGILWFFAGHLMESTVLPLEMVYEHRNYLPSFGIFLAAVAIAQWVLRKRPGTKPGMALAAASICLALAFATHQRAWRWSDEPWARLAHLEGVQSPRAAIEAAQTYQGLYQRAAAPALRERYLREVEREFRRAAQIAPDSPDPYFGWLMFYARNDLEIPQAVVAALDHRLNERSGFNKVSFNGLAALTNCVVKGACLALQDQVAAWNRQLAAPESGMSETARARMLHNGGRLECALGDASAAAALLQRAAAMAPADLGIGLDLVHCLLKAGRRAQAAAELKRLQGLDPFLIHFDTLSRLRWLVAAAQ